MLILRREKDAVSSKQWKQLAEINATIAKTAHSTIARQKEEIDRLNKLLSDGYTAVAAGINADLQVELTASQEQVKILRKALENVIPRCSKCEEVGIHIYSDEDGSESMCELHKADNFYSNYDGLDGDAIVAKEALAATAPKGETE